MKVFSIHLLMLSDIDHFVEEANFLCQKSYKTDQKKAIISNIQNLDKQCRVSLFPTKKQNPNLTINVAGKMTMLLSTELAKKIALFHE